MMTFSRSIWDKKDLILEISLNWIFFVFDNLIYLFIEFQCTLTNYA